MFFLKGKLLSTRFRKLNGRYNISISTYFYAALPSRVEFSIYIYVCIYIIFSNIIFFSINPFVNLYSIVCYMLLQLLLYHPKRSEYLYPICNTDTSTYLDAQHIIWRNMILSFITSFAMMFDASPTGSSTITFEVFFILYKLQVITGIYSIYGIYIRKSYSHSLSKHFLALAKNECFILIFPLIF